MSIALANAIVELVGQVAEQRKLVDEMKEAAPTCLITTPNKWLRLDRTL